MRIDPKLYHTHHILSHHEVSHSHQLPLVDCIYYINCVLKNIFFTDHVEDPKPSSLSGVKMFLLMMVGAIAIIACVVFSIMFYQKHQENSRKRFY